ncbi:MAG: tetratricopeptide repeat protein [Acidobacteria bacterium]|nr:tetratricopeptide repeat protein [Acidobacteriota bacterium]
MKWPTSARMLPCLLTLAAAALLGSGCSRPARERGAQFLDRGKKHLNEKDYERAILDLNNAARVLPTDPEPHYQLGLAYLAKGQVGPAVGSFKMACDRNPRHAEAQLKLAELLLLSNEPEMLAEADKHAQAGLALTPDSADALQTAAAAELRLGKLDQASRRLTRALGKDPQHLRSWFTLAAVKVASKNFAEAERTLRRAVEQAPRAVEAWIALGQFYLTVSKHSEAEDQFRRALEIDSKNGPAMLELARLQARDGRQEQAEKTLRQLSVLPDKAYRSLHAQFLFQAGRREAAIAELETLSRQDPQDREVRSRLVEAYLAVNRSTDAEKVLAEVLRRNSQDVDALEQRSRLYLSAGKADQAEADLLQVLRFRPASAQAHYLLAQAHKGRENRAGYRQELEEALKLDRSLLAARIEISESLRASRAGKTALELMEQAPQDQKARLEAVVERNWTLLSMGDYAAARRGVDQGMKTGRPTALLLQDGLLKMSLKNFAAARVSLEEVLRQTPEDLQALEALANTFVAEKRPAAAIERIRLQASRQPVRPALQHFLGAWLENSGDTAGARAAYAAQSPRIRVSLARTWR